MNVQAELPLEIWAVIILHVRGERARYRAAWAVTCLTRDLFSMRKRLARMLTMQRVRGILPELELMYANRYMVMPEGIYTHFIRTGNVFVIESTYATGDKFREVVPYKVSSAKDAETSTDVHTKFYLTCVHFSFYAESFIATTVVRDWQDSEDANTVFMSEHSDTAVGWHLPYLDEGVPLPCMPRNMVQFTGRVGPLREQFKEAGEYKMYLCYTPCEFVFPSVIRTSTHVIELDYGSVKITPHSMVVDGVSQGP